MALFLIIRAIPSLQANNANFIASSEFITTDPENLRFGIADLFRVTVLSSVFALVIAVPISIGIATFLTNYAPKALAKPCGILVDLLAAVPSIVFGLWGVFVLAPWLVPVQTWLNENLDWFFLFKTGNVSLAGGGTIFTAGVVLAVMILPGSPRVSREVFSLTPKGHVEAAPGPRGHEVGSGPDDRLPLRPCEHDRRFDAGAGTGPRRDHRGADHPAGSRAGRWLVAVRRRLHLCLQDRLGRSGIQFTSTDRRLHRSGLRVVRSDIRGQWACSAGCWRKG